LLGPLPFVIHFKIQTLQQSNNPAIKQFKRYILPLIVLSQFAGTSLWFVGNAILPELQNQLHLEGQALGNITSVVQLGFISGTLVFALLSLADRYPPSRVFLLSSVLAALSNLAIVWIATDVFSLMILRYLTGFFLAGIYPVGMKIAADWYEKGLGKALGYLVGALVLGTAFPHLLKGSGYRLPAKEVIYITSAVAVVGGLLMWWLVPAGPFRKQGVAFHPRALIHIFRSENFRAAAGGYFGHMWELYTFWAFVPVLLQIHSTYTGNTHNIPLWSFLIIAMGSLSCVAGGYWAGKIGSGRVAFYALLVSGVCCCVSGLFIALPAYAFFPFLLLWGLAVIADSPQFSALVAQTAPAENKGTALTFVTCIGFAITIVSIQFVNYLHAHYPSVFLFTVLAAGPLTGLTLLYRLVKK
jgi:MFS family permease